MTHTAVRRLIGGVIGCVAAMALLAGCRTQPAFVVNTTQDSVDAAPGDGVCADGNGLCSLRAAVMEANAKEGADHIALGAGQEYVLTVAGTDEEAAATGDLDLTEAATIDGNDARIRGDGSDRIVDVRAPSGSITLKRVILAGGRGPGAAIAINDAASVSLVDSVLDGNDAMVGAPVDVRAGSLLVLRSTVANNTGQGAGAITAADAALTIENSTLSANASSAGPAAIAVSAGSNVAVTYATITGGTSPIGAVRVDPGGALTSMATIIDGGCTGTVISGGHNLESGSSCNLTGVGDQQGVDPRLGELADNGGLTPTHLPAPSSPVIDAVSASAAPCDGVIIADQRGRARQEGAACDVGAVEVVNVSTLHVNTRTDSADTDPGDGICTDSTANCSLRAAISEANALPGDQTVVVDPAVTTINLTLDGANEDANSTGDLDVTDELIIEANGATIDASTIPGRDRVLQVFAATTLHRAVITGGQPIAVVEASNGGGIRVATGVTFGLDRSTITGNGVPTGLFGGGLFIERSAIVQIDSSTLSGNTAFLGGGAATEGSLAVRNSTISGNETGGLYVKRFGSMTVTSSTVTANTGDNLDGDTGFGVPVTVKGSIVANPVTGTNCGGGPAYTSGGYNLSSTTQCPFSATGDRQSTDPQLGLLADNGGPTRTHRPADTSPVIDAIPFATAGICDGSLTADQRNALRPGGAGCDIGAVENLVLTVTDGSDTVDASTADMRCADAVGACTFRAAVDQANAVPGADRITVGPHALSATLTRSGADDTNDAGDIDINDEVAIAGNDMTLTQTASGERVLNVRAPVTMARVTVTGGHLTNGANGGAGILATAALTLTEVTVTNNHASGSGLDGGGIAISSSRNLSINRSTISGNTADDKAGGVCLCGATGGGVATVRNATISGNAAGEGGGIWASAGTAELTLSTVTANSGSNLDGNGPGAFTHAGSIIANPASGNDCDAGPGAYTSGGHNVSSGTTCNLSAVGDRPSTNPLLGALRANGGPTRTHLPSGASPTLDAIPAGTPGLCDGSIPTDQRNAVRPDAGSDCDTGAVERKPTERDCGPPPNLSPGADLRGCNLAGANLANANLVGANLTNANLTGATVTGASLTNATLRGADLTGVIGLNTTIGRCSATWTGATVPGIDLANCDLTGDDLRGADLTGANLSNTVLTDADLGDADLTGATWSAAVVTRTDFAAADLRGFTALNTTTGRCTAIWTGARVPGIDLSGCDLTGDDLSGADFSGADLDAANLTSAVAADLTLVNASLVNALLTNATVSGANLAGANVQFARFEGANFTNAELTGALNLNSTPGRCAAVWTGAQIPGIVFFGCDLSGDDLTGTNLTGANLGNINLTGANLTDATLTNASFTGADLDSSNLFGATISGANFTGATFDSASGTETMLGACSATWKGAQILGFDLDGCDFSGDDFTGTLLNGASLSGVQFDDANLSATNFYGATLTNADLTGATVTSTTVFVFADVGGADFTSVAFPAAGEINDAFGRCTAIWTGTRFTDTGPGINLGTCDLTGSDLTGTDLGRAWLADADLTGAIGLNTTLERCTATWTGAQVPGIDLSGCSLRTSNLSATNLTGADLQGADLTGANLSFADLSGANLSSADLSFVTFEHADLAGVLSFRTTIGRETANYRWAQVPGLDFEMLDLRGTAFTGANLAGANLRVAYLAHVDLSGANLVGADLYNANALGANLTGADLTDAVLVYVLLNNDARLVNATITNADLSLANLATADLTGAHGTPSFFAPASFLRTTCPTGINSDTNGGSCDNQWLP